MINAQLNERLVLACDKATPNLNEIKELIIAGAETNQLNKYGENIFEDVFLELLYDICDNGKSRRELSENVEKIKETISLMIEYGFDIKRFGLAIMSQFMFSTYDVHTFDLYRHMLQFDIADDSKAYEDILEGVGTEESFQRCCENNHDLENLFYAIYEMIDAKKEGRDYTSIEPYYDAVGMTIDKIVYFNEAETMVKQNDYTEYYADIGFVCGDKLLVMCNSVNILFMNDRIAECPQIDISAIFGKDAIGRKIKAISFDHRDVVKGTTYYGQPTIIIELANGKKLKFSHNFGELPDKKAQPRFWIE